MLKAIQPDGSFTRPEPKEESACKERHYSVNELAVLWNFSKHTIRKLCYGEADVIETGKKDVRHKHASVEATGFGSRAYQLRFTATVSTGWRALQNGA